MKHQPTNIAVLFDTQLNHATELFRGVSDVSRQGGRWNLIPIQYNQENLLQDLIQSGTVNGVIGGFVSDAWLNSFPSCKVCFINTANLSKIRSVPNIVSDDCETGRLAASHLLEKGFTNLAFLGSSAGYFSFLREQGFAAEAAKHGITALLPNSASTAIQISALENWLLHLPFPCGLFCAEDRLARRCIITALKHSLRVPEDLAVIGCGDSPINTVFSPVSLTGIIPAMYRIGGEAGQAMSCCLAGKKVEDKQIADLHIEQRSSTDISFKRSPLVSRAVSYLDMHIDAMINIESLASQLGVSRRVLELRFREEMQVSPYRYLQQIRLTNAESLLKESSLKIREIAERCGYPEQHQFSLFFKKEKGMSPRKFRSEHAE